MLKDNNEFAADVLATLQKRKVTLRGCKPDYLETNLDGSMKIWFYGDRQGKLWRGGVTIHGSDVQDDIHLSNSDVVAETCERLIDHTNSRFY